jgi:hypothetical protein
LAIQNNNENLLYSFIKKSGVIVAEWYIHSLSNSYLIYILKSNILIDKISICKLFI